MANHPSAAKATRQAARRGLRNKSVKSGVKTQVRRAEAQLAGEEPAAAGTVAQAVTTLDRAAQKGILHPNNVARRKSRLMRKLNAAKAATAAAAAALPAPEAEATTKPKAKPRRATAKKTETAAKPAAPRARAKKAGAS